MNNLENIIKGPLTSALGFGIMMTAGYGWFTEYLTDMQGAAFGTVGFALLFMRDQLPGFIGKYINNKIGGNDKTPPAAGAAMVAFFILASFSAIAQKTDTQLTTQSDVIRNETAAGGNTKTRIADMYQALIDSKVSRIETLTASGTDTYAITATSAITSYVSGQQFLVKFTNANTGAATLNVNGLGVKAIKKSVSTALSSGDISAGQILLLSYDGTNFQIVGSIAAAPAWGVITGTLSSQSDLQTALNGKQSNNSDLTAIAALTPTNDDILQRKAGAWTNRTIAQLKTDLGTWPATAGGTGLTSYTTGDVMYASATNTLSKLAAGTDGYALKMSSGIPVWAAPVSVDGVTITGNGTAGSPLVASGTGLQAANNLSELSSMTASRSNLGAAAEAVTITGKSTGFTPGASDFVGIAPLYNCTSSLTITLPSDATSAIAVGRTFYGRTSSGTTTTFSAGSGASVESSSGTYIVTPASGADFTTWAVTKKAANTWTIQIGSPPSVSATVIMFSSATLTHTNMPAGVQAISNSAYRFDVKFDLTNFTSIRAGVGCSIAGASGSGFYIQYSTDESSWNDIGSASGSDLALLTAAGGNTSNWISIPGGAKADIWLRAVSKGGDGAADPVTGTIYAIVK